MARTRLDVPLATVTIAPGDVLRLLGTAVAALVLIPILFGIVQLVTGHDSILGTVQLFDVTLETNVPAWFSGGLLFTASLTLLLVARTGQTGRRALLADSSAAQWYGLAFIFAFLSLDEIAQLHERTTIPVRSSLGTSGLLHYAWVIPALFLVLVVGALYWRFLLRLPRTVRTRTVVAAILFAGGAIGGDMLGGLIYALDLPVATERFLIWAVTLVEEGAEMGGVLLFIHTLLLHVATAERGVEQASDRQGLSSVRATRLSTATRSSIPKSVA